MIKDLDLRIQEAGRIRIGHKLKSKNGKTYPGKLESFRLTSADEGKLQQAAALWGGDVAEWADAPVGKQWELFTSTNEMSVLLPPSQMAFSQHYETWSAGGCQRRCDGEWEQISEGACVCGPARERACKPHTRLSLILPDLDGIALWRLDTQGWNAAAELGGVVHLIAGLGIILPAKLRLEQRQSKRDGQTHNFAVPTIDFEMPARTVMHLTTRDTYRALPQFSAAQDLSQEVRGQMMALARDKGLTDATRHQLSEGASWSDNGGLSNADAQRIMAAMREMPSVLTLDAPAISEATHPHLYRPATAEEAAAISEEEWTELGRASGGGESVNTQIIIQPNPMAGTFTCDAVKDGVACIRTSPHSKAHAFQQPVAS